MREIQPVVPCFLQLPYHLVSNSLARSLSFFRSFVLSFFLSLFFFLSLSLTLSFLRQISFEQCHMFEGLFCDNLSDSHLLHSIPWPSHRAISTSLERTWMQNERKMHANERKKKGHACTLEWKWKEYERKMKGNEYKWKDNERKMTGNECNMKGICMQMKGRIKSDSTTSPDCATRIAQLFGRIAQVGLRNLACATSRIARLRLRNFQDCATLLAQLVGLRKCFWQIAQLPGVQLCLCNYAGPIAQLCNYTSSRHFQPP